MDKKIPKEKQRNRGKKQATYMSLKEILNFKLTPVQQIIET